MHGHWIVVLLAIVTLAVAGVTNTDATAVIHPWTPRGEGEIEEGGYGTVRLIQDANVDAPCFISLEYKLKLFTRGSYVISLFETIGESQNTTSTMLFDGCRIPSMNFTASRVSKPEKNLCLVEKNENDPTKLKSFIGTFVGISYSAVCDSNHTASNFVAYGVVEGIQVTNEHTDLKCYPEIDWKEDDDVMERAEAIPEEITITYTRNSDGDLTCECSVDRIEDSDWKCDNCLNFYPGYDQKFNHEEEEAKAIPYTCVYGRTQPKSTDLTNTTSVDPTTSVIIDSSNTSKADSAITTPVDHTTSNSSSTTADPASSSLITPDLESSNFTTSSSSTTSEVIPTPSSTVAENEGDDTDGDEEGPVTDKIPVASTEDAEKILDDQPSRKGIIAGIVFASIILAGMVLVMIKRNKMSSRSDGFKRMYGEF